MMPESGQDALPIPGLGDAKQREPELVAAARRTIRACAAAELLTERDSLTCQLILELSAAVAKGTTSGRASAAAMAAAQLLAAIDRLPTPEGSDEDDPYTQLARELREAAGTAGLDPAGSGPAGGNSS